MADWAAALAAGLDEESVPATWSGLLFYNNIEFLATIFAANYVGAVTMPINWRLAAGAAVHPRALRSSCPCLRRRARSAHQNDATNQLDGDLVRVCISTKDFAGWERFADLAAESALPAHAHVDGDDMHRLMYASGPPVAPRTS